MRTSVDIFSVLLSQKRPGNPIHIIHNRIVVINILNISMPYQITAIIALTQRAVLIKRKDMSIIMDEGA
jgi:hypothetical protein